MQKNSGTRTKTFEFLTLFCMVIGVVVGAGIYMKNNELLRQTHNPIIAIILWGVVGLVCVGTIIVFIEISSSTKHFGNGTVGNWTKLFIGRRTASFFSLFYMLIYIPSSQAFFVAAFIMYFFDATQIKLTAAEQLTIYLLAGVIIISLFSILNTVSQKSTLRLQVFGTIFKFIPLLIAFVAGFILIDKIDGTSAMWNNGNNANGEWSTSNWNTLGFIGGFGAILFAFDGFIYLANVQKTTTNKNVVPWALFFGMLFVAIFYILMALSLFLGSPDGSVQSLLNKLFVSGTGESKAANIISNVILMIICMLNINVFTFIGVVGVESDAEVGLLYTGKDQNITLKKSVIIQSAYVIGIYITILVLSFCIPFGDWNGIITTEITDNYLPLTLVGSYASAVSAMTFFIIALIMFAGIRNRYTNKVEVEKIKLFLPLAWICGIMMSVFTFLGVFVFIYPQAIGDEHTWFNSEGFSFTLFTLFSLAITISAYFIQERMFIKNGIYEPLKEEDKVIYKLKQIITLKQKD